MPIEMGVATLEQIQNADKAAVYRQYERTNTNSDGSLPAVIAEGDTYRLVAVRDAGLQAGARGGFNHRTRVIQSAVEVASPNLDALYNFSPLMIEGRVVPPVLVKSKDLVTQTDENTYLMAGRRYQLISSPKFSSRPPHWRQYLVRMVVDDALPDPSLLPRDKAEREIWSVAVADGWKQGVNQANETFKVDLARLNRDYTGMVNYHVLAMAKMVTVAEIAQQAIPINATGRDMALDGKLLRITTTPEFVDDMKQWQPLVSENEIMEQPNDSARDRKPIVIWDSRNDRQAAAQALTADMKKEGVWSTPVASEK